MGRGKGGQLPSSDQTNISCHLSWCSARKPGSNISKAAISQGLTGYQLGGELFPLCHSGWVEFFVPFSLIKESIDPQVFLCFALPISFPLLAEGSELLWV